MTRTIDELNQARQAGVPSVRQGYPPMLQRFGADEIDLLELARKLWRRKHIIIGTAALITLVALVVILQLTPRYTAQSAVVINARESKPLADIEAVISGLPQSLETVETELQVLRSRSLAAQTIEKLNLEANPEFNSALREKSAIDNAKSFVKGLLKGGEPESALSEGQLANRIRVKMIDSFLRKLGVAQVGNSYVITIAFTSESPTLAADVSNTLADFYIVSQLEAKFDATRRANDWLSGRVSELRARVQEAEEAVERYRQDSGLIEGGREVTLATEQISELNAQLVSERAKLVEAEARLKQVEALLASEGGVASSVDVLSSPLILRLREQEAEVERKIAELSSQFGERHPRMKNARNELRELRAKIGTEVDRIVKGLQNEVAVARVREVAVTKALDELKKEVGRLNATGIELRALEREAEASRTLLESILARSKETTTQESFQEPDASVLHYADPPTRASFPKKTLLLALTMVAAGALGVLAALIVELLDRGLRSSEQIESQLGIATLGLFPAIKRKLGLGDPPETYVVKHPNSAYAEAIRSLHTTLLLSHDDKPAKVVLMASSLPKEGKTTTTLAFANFLAMAGLKVLVIDCDLRRPKLHRHFGVEQSPGLSECIASQAQIGKIIHEHPETGAHLVAAGETPHNPSKMLTSPQLKKLIAGLSSYYEIILIDSAPVLAVSDTRLLSRLADKTVFLVRWSRTRREVAQRALRQLLDSGANVAGAVLTIVDVKKHAYYSFSDSGAYVGSVTKYYRD